MRSNAKRAGFTLVELLIVFAIIGILTGLLFPVFVSARDKARQIACISNARQIGIALQEYAADNDDHFMTRHDNDAGNIGSIGVDPDPAHFQAWYDWIQPYVGSKDVDRCPGYSGQFPISNTTGIHGSVTRYVRSTYLISDNIVSNPDIVGSALANIPSPSSTILVAESSSGNTAFADAGTGIASPDPGPTGPEYLMCPEASIFTGPNEMHSVRYISSAPQPWCYVPAISARVTCVAVDGSAKSVIMDDGGLGAVTRDSHGLLHDPPGGYSGLYITGPDGELTIPGT